MGVDWFESCDMRSFGHGGTGSVPSAFSMGVDWFESCDMRSIEYPVSVNASRVRQQSFLDIMVSPFWIEIWAGAQFKLWKHKPWNRRWLAQFTEQELGGGGECLAGREYLSRSEGVGAISRPDGAVPWHFKARFGVFAGFLRHDYS